MTLIFFLVILLTEQGALDGGVKMSVVSLLVGMVGGAASVILAWSALNMIRLFEANNRRVASGFDEVKIALEDLKVAQERLKTETKKFVEASNEN